MKTTSPISPPLALGDILADLTQALPDENQRFSPHPPTVVPTPAPTRRAVTPPSPARPGDVPHDALFIGIDWADDHPDLCLFDPATQQRTSQSIAHDPPPFCMPGSPVCIGDSPDDNWQWRWNTKPGVCSTCSSKLRRGSGCPNGVHAVAGLPVVRRPETR